MKTRQLDVGQVAELAVALEVLDQAPAVDVLEDDAQLARPRARSRRCGRCSRGRAPRSAAPPRRRAAGGSGSGVLSCLMTIGRWKPAWPSSRPLRTVPMPPAPSSWRIRYFGSARTKCDSPGSRARGLQSGPGVSRQADAILAGCASWPSTWATCGSASRSPTRRRRSPPASRRCARWARARTPRRSRRSCASTSRARSWSACPGASTAALGPQAEKVLAFVERLRRVAARAGRDAGRAAHLGRGRRAPGRGRRARAATRKARIDQAAAVLILQELPRRAKAAAAGGGRRERRVTPRPRPARRRWASRPRSSPCCWSLALAGGACAAWSHETTRPKIAAGAPAGPAGRAPGRERRGDRPAAARPGPRAPPARLPAAARQRGASARGSRPASTRSPGRSRSRGSSTRSRAATWCVATSPSPRARNIDEIAAIAAARGPRRRRRSCAAARDPAARPRPRPRGARPRGLPLPRHLRPPAGAGGAARRWCGAWRSASARSSLPSSSASRSRV